MPGIFDAGDVIIDEFGNRNAVPWVSIGRSVEITGENATIKRSGIEINASEVDNKVDEIANDAEDKEREKTRQFFSLPQVRQSIEQSLLTQKTMDRLLQITIGGENITKEE
jgi:transcriptional regulator of heat shock response